MARMEGNALSAPPTRVNLAQVLEDVAPALSELATRAGNSCTVSPAPPLCIEGYDSLLFRLVFNLAENAIKYTPPVARSRSIYSGRAIRRFWMSRTMDPASPRIHWRIFSIVFTGAIRPRRRRYRFRTGSGPFHRSTPPRPNPRVEHAWRGQLFPGDLAVGAAPFCRLNPRLVNSNPLLILLSSSRLNLCREKPYREISSWTHSTTKEEKE